MKQIYPRLAVAACMLAASTSISAQVLPYGPQNDVAYSTVVNDWGWSEIWRGAYSGSADISTIFAGHDQYVMIGALNTETSLFEVLAATTYSDAIMYTALNQTHLSNGASWYSNGYSMGFAGATDQINQMSADADDNGDGQCCDATERDRLSWHTSTSTAFWIPNPALPAASIQSGWRAGSVTSVYSPNWQRVILTAANVNGAVPEPSTWAMMLLGFGAVGYGMRRRRRIGNTVPQMA